MNEATRQMKQEAQSLIVLLKKTNNLLEFAEECGVRIGLNCGGDLGPKESTKFVVFEKCVGDYLKKSQAKKFNLSELKNRLRQIERKLKALTNAGYWVTLDTHNRKGYAVLYLEHICIILYDYDFTVIKEAEARLPSPQSRGKDKDNG